MNIRHDIELFRQIKPEFIAAVHSGEITAPDDLLLWLRKRLSLKALTPDSELGFSSVEEELEYAKGLSSLLSSSFVDATSDKSIEQELIFGDGALSRNRRNQLLGAAASLLDDADDDERKLKDTLEHGVKLAEDVTYFALRRAQPPD